MILLDTSLLIEALGAGGTLAPALRGVLAEGERVCLPTLVVYEWLRGPRIPEELHAQQVLFPLEDAVPFGPPEAALAARLYGEVAKPRGREIDLAIAACAISWDASLWTLNERDFDDIPGVKLMRVGEG
ncbi:MAG: type II toxin-antitoxin system VapC family toxin [Gemmatimonadetes bacterium]|nr:type II toxin-antitoxin system VapC family toxin [Gemmatimonadota bacterium]